MEQKEYHITVPATKGPQRLDNFLTEQFPHLSRTRLKNLIDDSHILVNDQVKKPSYRIRHNDHIHVTIPKPKVLEILPEPIPLDIFYEDEYLLVVNKKAGMVVHPAFANYNGTLVNALLHHCTNLSGIGGVKRPGIVHRLDKDTSGLLVVAKSDFAHRHLSEQFSARTTRREYFAIVWGHFRKKSGRIENYIRRSPKNRLRMIVSKSGKFAVTNYDVIEEFPLFSALRIKLETGRTHQIRVHMTHLNHPLFGDATYGGRSKRLHGLNKHQQSYAVNLLKQFNRPMLHAKSLGFQHPQTKEQKQFDSELPEDMQRFLSIVRNA